ncbi:Riboflavin synthase [Gracilariopsis chorda]|uniref:Riboflavin synthase n=1 Tax=Gracilariopsis chorda TaxID=448386 RepID=A0A2V3J401_9FLOR|nr:Riboflavin synthase [Gracilariopsis chorda]|eukprot:PXF48717.1 Riboflavin synthase [Gracilariopsis chorda]
MVFTGIVEELGTVISIEKLDSEEGGANMTIAAERTLAGVSLGDSISVNGTCLTVTTLEAGSFNFGLAPETLRRTNLGDLKTGSKVNLERSLAADGRFGGHVVQGHVDCTGTITDIRKEKDAIWFTIGIPREYMKYVVEKGYVAVDGTSLTVCDVLDEQNSFTFMMIAYTQAHVVTALKSKGDAVNVEVDITGKYVERILAAKGLS